MTTLRKTLQDYQEATGCSHYRLLNLVCQWIELKVIESTDELMDFVVNSLTVPPGDRERWRQSPFTEEDQDAIVACVMDELSGDSLKDRAHEHLEDEEDMVELIGYADPDPNLTSTYLTHLIGGDPLDIYHFLDDLEEHSAEKLDLFLTRMGLFSSEDGVTELGRAYVDRHL